ncbi:uncharacterized protein [Typha latifolia]|uniref:uncharacterized protein n=1 Tax=Typha latifolia TaxID=4733 RepID=UPI003C2F4060
MEVRMLHGELLEFSIRNHKDLAFLSTTWESFLCILFLHASDRDTAFGDDTPGNIFTGFSEPFWLIDVANFAVLIHLIGAYQIFAQPLFAFYEQWLATNFPNSAFFNRVYSTRIPFDKSNTLNSHSASFSCEYLSIHHHGCDALAILQCNCWLAGVCCGHVHHHSSKDQEGTAEVGDAATHELRLSLSQLLPILDQLQTSLSTSSMLNFSNLNCRRYFLTGCLIFRNILSFNLNHSKSECWW